MRTQVRYMIIAAVSMTLFMMSCKDENATGDEGSPSNVVFPTSNVSYDQHVQILFNQACAYAGCHDDGQHTSPLKLTSWFNTTAAIPGIVVARQPDQSLLISRIQGSLGERMPINANPLNQNQINGIRTWIAEGARQN